MAGKYMRYDRVGPLLRDKGGKKLRFNPLTRREERTDIKVMLFRHEQNDPVIPDPTNKEESDKCMRLHMSRYYDDFEMKWLSKAHYMDQRLWDDREEQTVE